MWNTIIFGHASLILLSIERWHLAPWLIVFTIRYPPRDCRIEFFTLLFFIDKYSCPLPSRWRKKSTCYWISLICCSSCSISLVYWHFVNSFLFFSFSLPNHMLVSLPASPSILQARKWMQNCGMKKQEGWWRIETQLLVSANKD